MPIYPSFRAETIYKQFEPTDEVGNPDTGWAGLYTPELSRIQNVAGIILVLSEDRVTEHEFKEEGPLRQKWMEMVRELDPSVDPGPNDVVIEWEGPGSYVISKTGDRLQTLSAAVQYVQEWWEGLEAENCFYINQRGTIKFVDLQADNPSAGLA